MRVLIFGTYDVSTHPRVAVLADGLRARGSDVDECNVPLGLDTAARVSMLQQPWRAPILLARLGRCWWRLARAARRHPAPDVVVIGYLGHFDVHLARALFPRATLVLDHLIFAKDTARDRRATGRLLAALLGRLDRAALGAADVVVVDTAEHRAEVPAPLRDKAVVVPVGAPQAWYHEGSARLGSTRSGPLRVVFFGLYTPLQGAATIGRALRLARDVDLDVTMVGTGQDRPATQVEAGEDPRVRWLDWVPAHELPALVAGHDVCLGIFGDRPQGAARGAEQGLPGARGRMRGRDLGHRTAAPGARRRRRARTARGRSRARHGAAPPRRRPARARRT
ncbi:MAG: hypothetical protein M3Q27_16795, partial [Actinomycetota bacterium]|nr:hypothetical protein [Actinomycetota bacterium]